MMTTLDYIDVNHGVAGSIRIKTELFFPCSLEELKAIKKATGMCKNEDRKKSFVNALLRGVKEQREKWRQEQVRTCAMYQCREISQAKAVRDLKVIESHINRLERNEEVIEQWQVELQTSSN